MMPFESTCRKLFKPPLNRFIESWILNIITTLSILYIVPSKVGPPTLTKAARSGRPALTVTWTAPQSDRPITKYQVQYRIGAFSWSTKEVISTSTILENLSTGTSYQVQVRAVSGVGAGPYSDVTTQITFRGMNVTTAFDVFKS